MSSGYEEVVRGGLKLKVGSKLKTISDGKVKKKKKTKSDADKFARMTTEAPNLNTEASSSQQALIVAQKTAAELKFEEIQKKRMKEKIKIQASKSHKDKVAEFNNYLSNLSEHYDIPKVGPG